MTEEWLEPYKEDFALLIESGFVAVKQLDEPCATRLFHAAQLLNPTSPAPEVGLGYIALNKLEIKEAIEIFRGVIRKDPTHHLAQTFLGMCYLLTDDLHEEGVKLIKSAIKETTDPTIVNLGEIALQWNEKDLRKKGAPFFEESKNKDEESKDEEDKEEEEENKGNKKEEEKEEPSKG